jgi:hypothetical protein
MVYNHVLKKCSEVVLHECRFDKRLRGQDDGSTLLTYTGLRGGLEHLQIETRIIGERFESVMDQCVI